MAWIAVFGASKSTTGQRVDEEGLERGQGRGDGKREAPPPKCCVDCLASPRLRGVAGAAALESDPTSLGPASKYVYGTFYWQALGRSQYILSLKLVSLNASP